VAQACFGFVIGDRGCCRHWLIIGTPARPGPIERLDVDIETLLQVALADLPQP